MDAFIDGESGSERRFPKPTFKKKIVKGRKSAQRIRMSLDDGVEEGGIGPMNKLKKVNRLGMPTFSKVAPRSRNAEYLTTKVDTLGAGSSGAHQDLIDVDENGVVSTANLDMEMDEDPENRPVVEDPDRVEQALSSSYNYVPPAPVYSLDGVRSQSPELIDKSLIEDEYGDGSEKLTVDNEASPENEEIDQPSDDGPLVLDPSQKPDLDEDRYDFEIMSDHSNEINEDSNSDIPKVKEFPTSMGLEDRIVALDTYITSQLDDKTKIEENLHELNEELGMIRDAKQAILDRISTF